MDIEFIKCHGSGNDFALIDATGNSIALPDEGLKEFSRLICDRRGPVGADGVLFLLPPTAANDKGNGPDNRNTDGADFRMRIFNADGSEAEMCGNGIRCAARLAAEKTGRSMLRIETAGAVLECRREEEIFPGVASFSVLIDNVSFVSADFPAGNGAPFIDRPIPGMPDGIPFSFISLGNPHLTARVTGIDSAELAAAGRRANDDTEPFPNGMNVTFYSLLSDQAIYTETFERGVGPTNACGTAMSACSIAACIDGVCRAGEWIEVCNKGGMVKCLVRNVPDGPTGTGSKTPQTETNAAADNAISLNGISVRLLGNATFEYTGTVGFDGKTISLLPGAEYRPAETEAYERFRESCACR